MLSFLGRMLFQTGLKFVYLWGEMEETEQEMCIRAFEQEADIKVMVSLVPTRLVNNTMLFWGLALLTETD